MTKQNFYRRHFQVWVSYALQGSTQVQLHSHNCIHRWLSNQSVTCLHRRLRVGTPEKVLHVSSRLWVIKTTHARDIDTVISLFLDHNALLQLPIPYLGFLHNVCVSKWYVATHHFLLCSFWNSWTLHACTKANASKHARSGIHKVDVESKGTDYCSGWVYQLGDIV